MSASDSPRRTHKVRFYVRPGYVVPDERLLSDVDPAFTEEVITTGVTVVRKKREIETNHALDQTVKDTVRQHELTCQALETEIASLKKRLRDATSMTASAYESWWRAGHQDSQTILQEKNDLINAHLCRLNEGMDYISRCNNRPGAQTR